MVRKNIARHQSGQTCSSRNGLQCNGLVRAELAAGKVVAAVVADDECVAMKLESLDIEEAMS